MRYLGNRGHLLPQFGPVFKEDISSRLLRINADAIVSNNGARCRRYLMRKKYMVSWNVAQTKRNDLEHVTNEAEI